MGFRTYHSKRKSGKISANLLKEPIVCRESPNKNNVLRNINHSDVVGWEETFALIFEIELPSFGKERR